MTFVANTIASFMRGTTTDQYGDEINSGSVYASRIPVGLTVRSTTYIAPDSGEPRIIQQYIGRVNPTVTVQQGDQMRDERTGQVFNVDTVTYSTGIAQIKSCRIELRVV